MSPETNPEAMVRPISPNEMVEAKIEQIPGEVVQVFNAMITEKGANGYACIRQEEVVRRLEEMGLNRGEIYGKGWLDVEEMYREAGWKVEYDKPGYNETYAATFTFKDPRK